MGNNDEKNLAVNLTKDSEVRKSRALLFAQTTPSNLPIPAQRLFLALLSNIDNKTTNEDNVFLIKGKDIADLAGLSPNVVGQQLEEMSIKADALRAYTLVIKEDDGNIYRTGLVSGVKFFKGSRAIRVSVDTFLMPYLRKMKEQFVISYAASGPMKFRSEYSIRLFEMMNYYLEDGGHYFTLQEVRNLFNIPDGKVTLTSTLNQKVVAPAMRDINTFTNLEVEVRYEKKGRTIIGYHFTVKDKNPKKISIEDNVYEEFISMLISPPYNFNKATLTKLIAEYGIDSVRNNFMYTKEHNPTNFSAYLNWAINKQAYEKTMEIKQIQEINESFVKDLPPPSQYKKEIELFEIDEPEKPSSVDFEKIKQDNPALYRAIMSIESKRKGGA